MNAPPTLSVVIPTYGRDRILVETIAYVLEQAPLCPGFRELIVVDQTAAHDGDTQRLLQHWHDCGDIVWRRLEQANLTHAMNLGLQQASGDIVLFTDDDIVPGTAWLVEHQHAHMQKSEVWAVVGQILQPGEAAQDLAYQPAGGHLRRYLDFPFRCTQSAWIENAMAGNLSVKKNLALQLGGFDENFLPPVASRFETEFAKRIIEAGGTIWFEPRAGIRHLQVAYGGTRSQGHHLRSALPIFGVGDYYYALKRGRGWERLWYIARKPLREIRTKFHLRHPWWIPVKLFGEFRAMRLAFKLAKRKPKLLGVPATADAEG